MDDLFDLCECGEYEDVQTDAHSIPLIGATAPDFSASTTNGPIKFPQDFAGKWILFFSHPSDFTPVCTSEFIAFQREMDEFEKLNVQLVGLSVGALSSHLAWLDAIEKMKDGAKITFPLIDDLSGKIAKMYGMIQPSASDTHAVRAVFVIDPNGIIRAILYYPAVLGRNINEIKRMIVGLQTGDTFGVAIPANWMPGNDVLRPAPSTATAMRQESGNHPWFMTYQKLDKDVIFRKIGKTKPSKK
ncbi:MAG: peroxiredoxin [Alphaproteobacteria bacterium]|nr:peroxiredoxin [Alphaproteobacteria bacterium]